MYVNFPRVFSVEHVVESAIESLH